VSLLATVGATAVLVSSSSAAVRVVKSCTIVADPTPDHHTVCPGAALFGRDLSYRFLTYADLSGADLSGANLSGTDLSRANLSSANLSRAKAQWVFGSRANFSHANLSGPA
jgi:hypothetical protein